MKRTALGMAAVLVLGVAAPAGAAIRIKRIQFDPTGADSGTNRQLNKEWILLKNTGPNDVQLRGWKVFDRGRDHVYRFGALFLEPSDTVRLHTGSGRFDGAPACEEGQPCPDNTHYDFYWGLDNYVWNNRGDRATLKNRAGDVIDRCAYTASADSPRRC